MGGYDDASGAWPALVEEIHRWQGDAVVSMEWLSAAEARHVRRIVDDLAPSAVTVVFTVRDLGRAVPSAWQEMMKNRRTWSYPEFLAAASSPGAMDTRPGRRFWLKVDVCGMLDTWATAVPTDALVVLTVPPPGAPHELLWRRFCEVLDIEPAEDARRAGALNQSLGAESTELLRRLNLAYRSSPLTRRDYDDVVKRLLGREVLAARRPLESRLRVPDSYRPWVEEAARAQVEGIRARAVRVVGDLDELVPDFASDGVDDPAETGSEALVGAALDAILGLALEVRRLSDDPDGNTT
jgi:hypothetical protein